MRQRFICEYIVDGEEFGLQGLEPYITRNRERAEQMERIIREAQTNGRLTLVMSDNPVFGRDGMAFPAHTRQRGGYSAAYIEGHMRWVPEDSIEKVVGRLEHLTKLLDAQDSQAALAVSAAQNGLLDKLRTYTVRLLKDGEEAAPTLFFVGMTTADVWPAMEKWWRVPTVKRTETEGYLSFPDGKVMVVVITEANREIPNVGGGPTRR